MWDMCDNILHTAHQALTGILSRFCTGCLLVPLAVQSSARTDHFKSGTWNHEDFRITVRAHLALLREASGRREGQQGNARISNRI